ncbi:MAG TPA: polysaccharide biosynthesis protein [Bacillota bacterium]
MSRDSFLQGALVLALAGLFSKIIGAVYRIPLSWVLRDEGFGLYGLAYPIYNMLLTISTLGVPIAVCKMIAERVAKGRFEDARRAARVSLAFLAVTGAACSLVLYASAGFFANRVYHEPRSYLCLVAVSPAIFLVAVMSALRGYFQGLHRMTPTAVSQVLEQIVRVATMFALSIWLAPRGLAYSAAGATFGAVAGAIAGLLFLATIYWREGGALGTYEQPARPSRSPAGRRQRSRGATADEGPGRFLIELIKLSVPISLAAIIQPLMNVLDATIVPGRLQATGLAPAQATALYGQLSQMAFPLVFMPISVTSAISMAMVPAVSAAASLGDRQLVRERAATGIRMTIILTLPCVIGLYLLSSEIPSLLYRQPMAGVSVAALSSGLLFLALQQTSSAVLQGLGRATLPLRSLAMGAAVKAVLSWILTGLPAFGIKGAAVATVVGFLVASAVNLSAVESLVGPIFDWNRGLVKPALATAVMALAVRGALVGGLALTGHQKPATVLAIAAGGLTYGLVLLAIGGMSARDLETIPRVGPAVSGFLRRFGFIH